MRLFPISSISRSFNRHFKFEKNQLPFSPRPWRKGKNNKIHIPNKDKVLSITFTILKAIGIAGTLGVLLVCPGMAKVILLFDPKNERGPFYPSKTNQAIERLRANGSIKMVKINGLPCYALTEKGKLTLSKYELKLAKIDRPKNWDEKWRVVIFDVREKRRSCRDAIRESLKQLGFKRLQQSVWIYPYKCKDVIELAQTAHAVRYDAKYLVCERFRGDEKYLSVFGLKDE